MDRDEINYVNAHATSTKAGDMAEYRAIRSTLPGSHVRMNSTKSMIGHLLGAAGAVEAIAAIEAIRTGIPSCCIFMKASLEAWGSVKVAQALMSCFFFLFFWGHVSPPPPPLSGWRRWNTRACSESFLPLFLCLLPLPIIQALLNACAVPSSQFQGNVRGTPPPPPSQPPSDPRMQRYLELAPLLFILQGPASEPVHNGSCLEQALTAPLKSPEAELLAPDRQGAALRVSVFVKSNRGPSRLRF